MAVLACFAFPATMASSADGAGLAAATQPMLDRIAASLKVQYRVLANRDQGRCGPLPKAAACSIAELTLHAPESVDAGGWQIYFGHLIEIKDSVSGEFDIQWINGDLYSITPNRRFNGFTAGETKRIQLYSSELAVFDAKHLPNYYITADGLQPRVIETTRFGIDPETGLETRPHVVATDASAFRRTKFPLVDSAGLYERNSEYSIASADANDSDLIPAPLRLQRDAQGRRLSLAQGVKLKLRGIERSALQIALQRLGSFGVGESPNGVPLTIVLDASYSGDAEAYRLDIGGNRIDIVAATPAGAFYALQSLAALLVPGKADIALLNIEDRPRYRYRGVHIDVARNFHSKQLILDVLDQMAAYKLNKLHLHLGDDEGWRLEIAGLPELTDIGSRRCHDLREDRCLLPQLGSGPFGNSEVDGYYSKTDYQQILRAAIDRHIQVIPSFDMPGHSRAAVKSMEARYRRYLAEGRVQDAEQYMLSDLDDKTEYRSIQSYKDNTLNVCRESTYAFIGKVIDEVKKMHRAAGQPLTHYHIGADETAGAWKASPLCRQFLAANPEKAGSVAELGKYFIQRLAAVLQDKDIVVAGWSDGLSHVDTGRMPAAVQSYAWGVLGWGGHLETERHANQGWQVIVSTPDALYFDFPYEAHPQEHGNYWATPSINTRKAFEFMPDNLPAHAEFWTDHLGRRFTSRDSVQKNNKGEITHAPMKPDAAYLGIQGQIWSETLRSDAQVEHMLFPRILAVAERAWREADWELPYDHSGVDYSRNSNRFTEILQRRRNEDWNRFVTTLVHKELPKLDMAGIEYHIPLVGAVVEKGLLKANVLLTGLAIEFRVDGGQWQPYTGVIKVDGKSIEVRAIAADGRRRGRSIAVDVGR